MILAQLRDAVRMRIGSPENDSFYLDPQLDSLINEALQTISVESEWAWLQKSTTFQTVTGQRFYTPPTDWQMTRALSIAGFDALSLLSLQEVRNWPDDIQDLPVYYTITAEQIYLAPAPNTAYTMRHDYIAQEAKLLDDNDAPIMPKQFHYAIVAFATHLAHVRSGDGVRASAALQEYNAWKGRMENRKLRTASPMKVRVRPGRDL